MILAVAVAVGLTGKAQEEEGEKQEQADAHQEPPVHQQLPKTPTRTALDDLHKPSAISSSPDP
jgi:hypothetical protein